MMEEDGELAESEFPISGRHDGRKSGVFQGEIDELESGIVRRKGSFGFYDLSDLPVGGFDGVGGVDHFSDLRWISEEGNDVGPIIAP